MGPSKFLLQPEGGSHPWAAPRAGFDPCSLFLPTARPWLGGLSPAANRGFTTKRPLLLIAYFPLAKPLKELGQQVQYQPGSERFS